MVRSTVHYDRPDDVSDGWNNVYHCVSYLAEGRFEKVYKMKRINGGGKIRREYCGKFMWRENNSHPDIVDEEINNEITAQ